MTISHFRVQKETVPVPPRKSDEHSGRGRSNDSAHLVSVSRQHEDLLGTAQIRDEYPMPVRRHLRTVLQDLVCRLRRDDYATVGVEDRDTLTLAGGVVVLNRAGRIEVAADKDRTGVLKPRDLIRETAHLGDGRELQERWARHRLRDPIEHNAAPIPGACRDEAAVG